MNVMINLNQQNLIIIVSLVNAKTVFKIFFFPKKIKSFAKIALINKK